ncbi:EpsG family protein [Providencia huaxiensis]|uniref:EpsG family protein n=1 Tax=Providencia huaxiensis TaxID=2027290 RepID=UPI0034E51BD4
MNEKVALKIIFLLFFIFIVSIFVGGRLLGVDPDYNNYIELFNYKDFNNEKLYEPSFEIIRYLYFNFGNNDSVWIVFLIFAFLSVCLKTVAILLYSKQFYLSIATYISLFLFLHDYTQIRISIGIAILFFSIHYMANNNWKKFILSIIVAISFHFTTIIYLPLYFLYKKISLNTFFILSLIFFFFALVLYILNISFIDSINEIAINMNVLSIGPVYDFNTMNMVNLSYAIIAFTAFFLCRKFNWDTTGQLYIKILFTGVSLFYFFGSLGLVVLAYRLSYLFYPIIIFLIPYVFNCFKNKILFTIIYFSYCFIILQFLIKTLILEVN